MLGTSKKLLLWFGACGFMLALCAAPAHADTAVIAPYALQQAMAAQDHVDLYAAKDKQGFTLDSSYFSGYASGVAPLDNIADNNTDQKLYALLIDGRYDFNHEEQVSSAASVQPYVMGGVGMATTGHFNGASSLDSQSSSVVPLFRVGGGVAYRLDAAWNLSLDYKAGLAAPSGGDQVFTGRGQQAVDLQTLNVGMSYAF